MNTPPPIVYAKLRRNLAAHWYYAVNRPDGRTLFCRFGFDAWLEPKSLVVVPHERNDLAAVEIIERAKQQNSRSVNHGPQPNVA